MEDKNILKIAKECLQYIKTGRVFVTGDIEIGEKFAVLLNEKIKTQTYHIRYYRIHYVDGKPALMFGFSDKKEKVINVLEKFIEEREK